jgi:hypothetical protein
MEQSLLLKDIMVHMNAPKISGGKKRNFRPSNDVKYMLLNFMIFPKKILVFKFVIININYCLQD